MRLVELDLTGGQQVEEVYRYLQEKLNLETVPEDKGELDRLSEALEALEENICVKVTFCKDKSSPLYEFGGLLERVMEEEAQTVEYKEDGTMYAVFAGIEPLEQGSFW